MNGGREHQQVEYTPMSSSLFPLKHQLKKAIQLLHDFEEGRAGTDVTNKQVSALSNMISCIGSYAKSFVLNSFPLYRTLKIALWWAWL